MQIRRLDARTLHLASGFPLRDLVSKLVGLVGLCHDDGLVRIDGAASRCVGILTVQHYFLRGLQALDARNNHLGIVARRCILTLFLLKVLRDVKRRGPEVVARSDLRLARGCSRTLHDLLVIRGRLALHLKVANDLLRPRVETRWSVVTDSLDLAVRQRSVSRLSESLHVFWGLRLAV